MVVTVSYVRECKVDKDAGTGLGEPVRVLDGIHGGLGWETGASAWGTREVHVSATGPRSMTSTDTLGSSLNLEASTQPDVPPGDGLSQRGQKRKQYPTPGLTSNDNIIIRVRPWGNFGRYGDWGPNVLWVKLRYTSHGDAEGLRRNMTELEGKWRGGRRTPLSLQ